jgi:hypothetical protein
MQIFDDAFSLDDIFFYRGNLTHMAIMAAHDAVPVS